MSLSLRSISTFNYIVLYSIFKLLHVEKGLLLVGFFYITKTGYNYLILYILKLYYNVLFQNLQIGPMKFNDNEYVVIFSSWSEGLINRRGAFYSFSLLCVLRNIIVCKLIFSDTSNAQNTIVIVCSNQI